MTYLCGRSPEELVRICEYEGRNTADCFSSPNSVKRQSLHEGWMRSGFDCYASVGVAFNKLHGEADDHIAIELEFMTLLHDRMLNNT